MTPPRSMTAVGCWAPAPSRPTRAVNESAALCQLTDLIVTAPDELRDQLCKRKTTRGKATLCARLRPRASRLAEPAEAAKFALRSLARRIAELDHEITALDEQLVPLVATAGQTTPTARIPPRQQDRTLTNRTSD